MPSPSADAPRPRRTRRNDPNRRDRIIDACLRVIAEVGVAGASHRKIAEAADVPLGSMTYHFTGMDELLRDIAAHNLQKRTVAFMENGTWAPVSARQMAAILAPLKNMTVLEQSVAIRSSLTEGQLAEIEALADMIAEGIR